MILLENINYISWPFKMGNENINAGTYLVQHWILEQTFLV